LNQVTIKDIARLLGMSPSSVSRALHDHPDISPATKEKVLALAKKLDYQPNSIARSLKIRKTRTIGVLVPTIRHDFFASVISGIEEVAYQAGYSIFVSQSNENYEREMLNVQALLSNRVDGLLVSISQTTKSSENFRAILKKGIPLVFFDRAFEDLPANRVIVDDYDGAYRAVDYLISRGYKKIAHLAGPSYLSISRERYSGYRTALKDHNIRFRANYVVSGGLEEKDGIEGMTRLFDLGEKPDAIFAVNDPVAIGAFIKIREKGLKIPDDIALVGFSNNPITSLIEPPMTTVEQPSHKLGQTAATLLLEQIENDSDGETKTIVLKTKLIVRGST